MSPTYLTTACPSLSDSDFVQPLWALREGRWWSASGRSGKDRNKGHWPCWKGVIHSGTRLATSGLGRAIGHAGKYRPIPGPEHVLPEWDDGTRNSGAKSAARPFYGGGPHTTSHERNIRGSRQLHAGDITQPEIKRPLWHSRAWLMRKGRRV